MPRPKGLTQQPKRWEIEERYGMGIKQVIYSLFQVRDSLQEIADELGGSRPTLYTWVGANELLLLKAQARYSSDSDLLEVKESVLT